MITIESAAFYELVEAIVARLREQHQHPEPFMQESEAMELLGIRSKTTMWKLRTEGAIAYTQPRPKIILYERASIIEYLERHKKEGF